MNALMNTYNRVDLAFERGEGAYLITAEGRRYLDFTSGIAVTALGHCHPHLVKALQEQGAKLWHTSNLFRVPGQERLAQRLTEASFADAVFFGNSGAEALECGFKLIRKYQDDFGDPNRYKIIAFESAFHGRTLATLAAAGNEKYLKGYAPNVEGFEQVPFGNLNEVRARITPETAAILIEPVQGEGGMRAADAQFLKDLRTVCDEFGLLLMFDEVQCGMGRTGKLFAHEWAGVTPDIMSTAKAIGGGFPLGACLATGKVAAAFAHGSHGSTFGGNPLGMAIGNAVLDVMLAPGFLDNVAKLGRHFDKRLGELVKRFPKVFVEVRGMGLLRGLKCAGSNAEIVDQARAKGLLLVTAADNVVRLLPPLIVTEAKLDQGIDVLAEISGAGEGGLIMAELMPEIRHFLDLDVLPPETLRRIIDTGKALKRGEFPNGDKKPLADKALAMIFEKPSTRTRISFELGMKKLGGDAVVLERESSQLGRGETVADTARVLSRYVDCIMVRTTKEQKLKELADNATVPVINGLTDRTHPCQLMADVMTFEEHRGPIAGKRVTWSGDGNNMATSWIHAAVQFGFELNIACPGNLAPPQDVVRWAEKQGGKVKISSNPQEAAKGADCIVTDTWVSMGDQDTLDRTEQLRRFQVDDALMKLAQPGAIFMHCLPAHRGDEMTASVIDGPQSAVWDEAENRLHAQQGILLWCLGVI